MKLYYKDEFRRNVIVLDARYDGIMVVPPENNL